MMPVVAAPLYTPSMVLSAAALGAFFGVVQVTRRLRPGDSKAKAVKSTLLSAPTTALRALTATLVPMVAESAPVVPQTVNSEQ